MAKTDSTKLKWRVQWRITRENKWVNAGLFETREDARYEAACLRDGYVNDDGLHDGVGFGNARVIRVEKKP